MYEAAAIADKAIAEGFYVVVSTKCASGGCVPARTPAHIKAGFLNPSQSRIQLQLAIASGYSIEETRELFEGPIRRVIGQALVTESADGADK